MIRFLEIQGPNCREILHRVSVLLFIKPILGNRYGPGVILNQGSLGPIDFIGLTCPGESPPPMVVAP